MSFFEELKRRNVVRVGTAYVVAAWVFLQVLDLVIEYVNAPIWIMHITMMMVAAGFPSSLIFAWLFEITPEGVKREKDVDRSKSIAPETGYKLDRVIIVFLAIAVVFLLADRFTFTDTGSPPQSAQTTESSVEADSGPSDPMQPATSGFPNNSIAVLPFVNMSSDPEQEYFSDGITEEILNRLAKIRELQVSARTSVFSFKGKDQDVRQIGEMLGVASILEGSVRKDGEQVRITAQLIRTSDGFHLWSETYDRKLESIFAIQDEIASKIASALEISLGISENQTGQRSGPINPEVYDLYLRARTLHRSRMQLPQAIDLFQRALEIDPSFAPAWAGLAHVYNVLEWYVSPEVLAQYGDQHARSLAAAEKALELDRGLSTALHAMGNYYLVQYEWARAQQYYEQALEADPDSTDAMEDYGNMLLYSLQLEQARKVAERMLQLDPYVPIFRNMAADLYNTQGKFDARAEQIEVLNRIAPDLWFTQGWNLQDLIEGSRFDDAHSYLDQIKFDSWVSQSDMHELVDWLKNGGAAEPTAGTLNGLQFRPQLANFVGRYDLFFQRILAEAPNSKLTNFTQLMAPLLSPEDMSRLRSHPLAKELLSQIRLSEYWDVVGWPDICHRVGEDDFACQ